jgi:hypothetical protein
MVEMKNVYKGVFSYRCELERLFAHAYSKKQAKLIMCRRLAKDHDVSLATVLRLFDGSKPNFEITIETEFVEGGINEAQANNPR